MGKPNNKPANAGSRQSSGGTAVAPTNAPNRQGEAGNCGYAYDQSGRK